MSSEPTNYVIHVHDGHAYAFVLDEDGDLASPANLGGVIENGALRLTQFDFSDLEKRTPQVEAAVDRETGAQFEPDPNQGAYIAGIRFALSGTEDRQHVERATKLPAPLAAEARRLLIEEV